MGQLWIGWPKAFKGIPERTGDDMAKKKETAPAVLLDIREAQQAFEQLAAELEQLDDSKVHPLRVDLQLAAAVAYSIANRDNTDPRRARLVAVAQVGVFDIAVLDRLPTMALAAWHARRMQLLTMEAATVARVSEAHMKEAQVTRGRMLRVLTYYYEDHEEHGDLVELDREAPGQRAGRWQARFVAGGGRQVTMSLAEDGGQADHARGHDHGEHGVDEKRPPDSADGLDHTRPHARPPVCQTRLWPPAFVPAETSSRHSLQIVSRRQQARSAFVQCCAGRTGRVAAAVPAGTAVCGAGIRNCL